jgi:hypothetical protein
MLGYADLVFPIAGTYPVVISTVGTNPIVSASIQVQIYPSDNRILKMITQPASANTNYTVTSTVQL